MLDHQTDMKGEDGEEDQMGGDVHAFEDVFDLAVIEGIRDLHLTYEG